MVRSHDTNDGAPRIEPRRLRHGPFPRSERWRSSHRLRRLRHAGHRLLRRLFGDVHLLSRAWRGGGGRCCGGTGPPHAVRGRLAASVAPHPPHGLSHRRALATVPGLPGGRVPGTMTRCPRSSFVRLGVFPTSPTWWRWGVPTGSTPLVSLRPGRSPPHAATSSVDVPAACTQAWRSLTGAPIGHPIRGRRSQAPVPSWSAPAATTGWRRRHPPRKADYLDHPNRCARLCRGVGSRATPGRTTTRH